ncbi:MAG: hypothetical protein FJZ63_01940 [Chlamydiae bacterium]|nr:hypothetical protein [Chlamydiota bacterium]
MSAICETNKGGLCAVCFDGFEEGQKQYTHKGKNGKNHDGLHEECLKGWLDVSHTCPICREEVDPLSLTSRTEWMMKKFKPALTNAAYAAGGELALLAASGGLVAGAFATASVGTVAASVAGMSFPAALAIGGSVVLSASAVARDVMYAGVDLVIGRRINEKDRSSIRNGVNVGASVLVTGMLALGPSMTVPAAITVMATSTLVAGIAAGIWSFIKG